MPDYIIRSIDPVLWRKVKARAASDGESLRTLILRLLTAYAAGRIK